MVVAEKPQNEKTITMSAKVYSPYNIYFDGEVTSLSAENDTGPFDVLPHHKNFISLLKPCEIIIRGRKEVKIKITQGILLVRDNKTTVFLDV